MNSCQITAFITALANYLSQSFTTEEITLLSTLLVQLGDTLVTILAQKSLCEENTYKANH